MDLQKVLTDAVSASRAERFKSSNQLSLGEMILKLEAAIEKASHEENPEYRNPQVKFDFCSIHPTTLDSWRGAYCELAIGYDMKDDFPKSDEFLKHLKSAIGKTFTGWKGGDYVMGRSTPVWVANPGDSGKTAVFDITYDGYWIVIGTGCSEY